VHFRALRTVAAFRGFRAVFAPVVATASFAIVTDPSVRARAAALVAIAGLLRVAGVLRAGPATLLIRPILSIAGSSIRALHPVSFGTAIPVARPISATERGLIGLIALFCTGMLAAFSGFETICGRPLVTPGLRCAIWFACGFVTTVFAAEIFFVGSSAVSLAAYIAVRFSSFTGRDVVAARMRSGGGNTAGSGVCLVSNIVNWLG